MIPFPDKKYKIIYADPPWSYENKKTGGSLISGAEQKYPTMPLQQICDLPVGSISAKNSCLFLWAVTPLLPEAFEVMESWGFKYKTSIYWRKIMSLGMGYWFRGQVEVCLVGTRGAIKPFRIQRPNFIQSKVEKHSKKPKELRGLIDHISEQFHLTPKIELFARDKMEGWDMWGDQAPTDEQRLLR